MPVLRTNVSSGMKALTAPHCRVILAQNHFGPKLLSPNHFFFIWELLGQTAFSVNNFDFGTSIKDKRTVSEYHNETNMLHSCYTLKDCEGKSKGMPGSTTIKETARKYN